MKPTRLGLTVRALCLCIGLSSLILLGISCRQDDMTHPSHTDAPEQKPALATAAAVPAFSQVSLFEKHGCGVTMDNRGFCRSFPPVS